MFAHLSTVCFSPAVHDTVNSEILRGLYFHETLRMQSFAKKTPQNGKISSFQIFSMADISFNALRENKILAEISAFTVAARVTPCIIIVLDIHCDPVILAYFSCSNDLT